MEHTEEKELYACCKSNATDTEACTDCTEEKTEEKCCGCHKTKHRSDEEYKKLIHRLNLSLIHILRQLSTALMARIHRNYRFIVGFNLMLILLGVGGIIQPTTSALLHNMSTLGISLKSMTDLLPEKAEEE